MFSDDNVETFPYIAYNGRLNRIYTPVTGVKGNEESEYRTGDVNLTCANIGAAESQHIHSASDITSGTFEVARIPGLPASQITSGTLDAARIPSLDAAKIGSGTLDAARIPSLDAAKIGSGTLDAARIPSLDAAKIASGILPTSRGGTGTTSYLENGIIEKINSSSSISTSNGHWKNGGSFTLSPGIYLIIIHTEWATNTTGIRSHTIATDDPDSADFAIPPNSTSSGTVAANGTVRITTSAFLSPANETTYYLGLYQTSGGALNCSTRRVRVIKLA